MLNFNLRPFMGRYLGKYRGILLSVLLFLLLDASVLILNFYISFQIADDAVSVNLAGRQRMLSQRMAKALFIMDSNDPASKAYTDALNELQLSQSLFDETLLAFDTGGVARGAGTDLVELESVSDAAGRDALEKAKAIWFPYKNALNEFIVQPDSPAAFSVVLAEAESQNLTLLVLMNELTLALERVAANKANTLRTIQTVGISLALLNFFLIMFHFLRQLRESDAKIEKARGETTEILETVSEGLFLIDKNFIIGEQHSRQLGLMLGDDALAGKSLQTVLKDIVTEKDAETATSFIELLFSPKVKENLIGDLNPLQKVEINVLQKEGAYTTRYLSFSFARAYIENRINHVLVTVVDITEKIKLEKALLESKKQNENQIEMLTSLLHTQPALIREFIYGAYDFFNRVNNLLKENSRNVFELKQKAQRIFREVHKFKGDSAALNLDYFEDAAHLMESSLEHILALDEASGNDFLGFAVQLEALVTYTNQVEQLADKLGEFGSSQPQDKGHNATDLDYYRFSALVKKLAERNKKQVGLRFSSLPLEVLPHSTQQAVRNIAIQLIRNAITHGIETPDSRERVGKHAQAILDLRISALPDNALEITVEDDGRGIDYKALQQRALASGRWTPGEIKGWDKRRLLSLIFKDGFSTANMLNKDAGRGVGLSAVAKTVNELGGKIAVSSQENKSCRFSIRLPEFDTDKGVAFDAVANGR